MKKIFLAGILLMLFTVSLQSQGCVAIRNIAGLSQFAQLGFDQSNDKWMINISGRYFAGYQTFVGTTKLPEGPPNDRITIFNREVNLSINKILKNGWSFALDAPISANSMSSKAEHKQGDKHTTNSFGIGDIRFTVYKWILKSDSSQKGNIQLGLGIKLPTGDYRFQDYYYYDPADPTAKQLAPVDPAIQLGDGGTGITTELNGFYVFNKFLSIYGTFFYLINPRDQNGVSNQKGYLPVTHIDSLTYKSGMNVNSVPDNYTTRAGANFTLGKFVVTTGLRYEGAVAHDLFGGDNGLRRVGHIFSIEPGLQFKLKRGLLYSFLTLPVARATIQTVPDKLMSQLLGKTWISGGHFANYLIFIGYAFSL
jgi:hypothetical protein